MKTKAVNILISSAGRRVELLKCFQSAREKINQNGKIVAVDLSDSAPACFFADKSYRICPIKDEAFIPELIEICKAEQIDAIIPTIDTELLKLSEGKELIEKESGAKVIVSDRNVIKICRDKFQTADFLIKNGFDTATYLTKEALESENIVYPLFIKPLNGSSSVNAFKVHNRRELDFFMEYVPDPIVQPFLEGKEYTVDILCDFSGTPITIVPRRRLAVRSGEISKGKVEKNKEIIHLMKELIACLKPIGPITVQLIAAENRYNIIEINPRFGGGVPMSIASGADSAENLYRLLQGEVLRYQEDYEDGVLGIRFDDAIFIRANGEMGK